MARPLPLLLILARQTLGLNQVKRARAVESSERTVQRWESKLATPPARCLHLLIDTLTPRDAALAAELATWAPRPGVPVPATAGPPVQAAPGSASSSPTRSGVASQILVDAIVCSAADAVSLLPSAIRPALRAAFARTHEVGLTVEEVMAALARE